MATPITRWARKMALRSEIALFGWLAHNKKIRSDVDTTESYNDKFPYFLGLGAGQSGTTWLHQCLSLHPELFLPRKKEIRYFSSYYHRPLFFYYYYFRKSAGRKSGEVCPDYSALRPDIISFVKSQNPKLRIIYLLRNPVTRTWSAIRRAYQDRLNTLTERELLQVTRMRIESQYVNNSPYFHSGRRWHNVINLRNWLSVFPDSQLHIVDFDQIQLDPETVLKDIWSHLRVHLLDDYRGFPLHIRVNKNYEYPIPETIKDYLSEFFEDECQELSRIVGINTDNWLS